MKFTTSKGVVNTKKAVASECLDQWNGNNMQYGGTGLHADIYKSKTGVFYLVHSSQWQGSEPYVKFIDEEDAYDLLINKNTNMDILKDFFTDDFIKKQEKKEI